MKKRKLAQSPTVLSQVRVSFGLLATYPPPDPCRTLLLVSHHIGRPCALS